MFETTTAIYQFAGILLSSFVPLMMVLFIVWMIAKTVKAMFRSIRS